MPTPWLEQTEAWLDRIGWSAIPELQTAIVSDLRRFHQLWPDDAEALDPYTYWALVEHLPTAGGAVSFEVRRWLSERESEKSAPLDPVMSQFLEPGEQVQHISAEEMAALPWR